MTDGLYLWIKKKKKQSLTAHAHIASHLLQSPQSHRRRTRWVVVFWAVWVCLTAAGSLWTLCCWQARLHKHQKQPLSQTYVNKQPSDHAHTHTCISILTQISTLSHTLSQARPYALAHNQDQNQQQEEFKRETGTWRDTDGTIFKKTNTQGCLHLTLWHKTNMEIDKQTPGWKQADLGLFFCIPPLPRFRFILPFLFPF